MRLLQTPIVFSLSLASAACGHARVVAPAPSVEARGDMWVAPDVRVLTGWGEPMYVVDGGTWIWRDGGWLRWEGLGWQRARPPIALVTFGGEP